MRKSKFMAVRNSMALIFALGIIALPVLDLKAYTRTETFTMVTPKESSVYNPNCMGVDVEVGVNGASDSSRLWFIIKCDDVVSQLDVPMGIKCQYTWSENSWTVTRYYNNHGDFEYEKSSPVTTVVKRETTTEYVRRISKLSGVNLSKIVLPDVCHTVNTRTFKDLKKLRQVIFRSSSFRTINDELFDGCVSLRGQIIPTTVTNIGVRAFNGCESLTEINLPDGLQNIGKEAFANCSSLATVKLPIGIKTYDQFFVGCSSLIAIEVDENNENFTSFDGALYDTDRRRLIVCPEGKTEITVLSTTTKIDVGAFSGCRKLRMIRAPYAIAGTIDEQEILAECAEDCVIMYYGPTEVLTLPNPPMEKDANISIYPVTDHFDADGGGLTISTSGSGTWTAVASEPWITLNSMSGTAGKPIAFRVSANTNVEERTAYIYVSGHVYTATQAGIGATVDKSNETFEHNGGFGTVNVTAQNRIVWQARPNVDWISVSPTSGSGEGSISYQVAPFNEVSTRQGTMTVAGNTVTVFQYGRRMKLATYEEKRDWYTHVIPITVDALAITEWSVTPNASWISVVDGGNGKGGDLVSIAILENPSYAPRTGTVTIGTETFTVIQDGRTDLEISIDPVESEASVNGANALLSVYATPDLPWTVTSDSSWVTIYDKFKNGAGNGNVVYTVTPNSTLYDRTAIVSITPEAASGMPTRKHTVTQPAAQSAISISGYEFEAAGESCSVEVSVADIVEWKIEENLDWITINGSTSRMGSGTVVIQAAANDTVYPRSGTITIARKTFTVTQKARGVEVEYDEKLFNARGGSGSVSIHPDGNVAWTVEVSDDWIVVWGDESGTGDAEIEYMVAAWNDEGSSRTGWIKIGDKKIYITQRAYDLSISPNGKKVTGNNGAGEIGVSASIGDVWNAIVTEPWITIVDGYDSGTGSGTVRFIYTENNTGKTRTGKIIVAGEVYTLEQAARTMVAITATAGRGGKVSGGGSYDLGSEVTLTAIPDDGYKFSYWTGDVSTMQNPLKVTADVATSVSAVFEPLPIAFESVTSGTDGVRLSWNNLAWATTYRIYRGVTSVPSSATQLAEIVNTGNCTYLDESGVVGTTYWYWIEAEGAEDSVMSDPMTGMKQKPVVISPITYQNLRGATHTNPSSYQEGTLVSFANLSGVTGYTFAGWTPERITEDMTGPQTVRANWIADKFNVKFNANGGTGDEVRVLEYGGAFGALPVPVKPYYRFIGWFTSPDGGERISESSIVAGATELFARWELNTVTANINGVEWVALCNDGVAMLGIGMENNNPAISTSHDGDIVVPEEINGCPVVEIGEYAFDGCSRLTSVIVPNSVTNIAEGAFSGCSSLTNMVLPFVGSERGNFGTREAVFGYVFGADSFEGGTLLRQYFGDGDAYTVNYCIPDKLKSVKITDEEKLGWGAFYGCRMLTEIDINEGIEYIGSFSFRNCTGISELVIPTTVEVIRHNAFRGSGIIKIVVPESVKSIEDRVFDSCSRLTNVTVQNSVTNIAEGAFSGCSSLTNMVLPFIGAARQSALPLYTTKASFGYIFGKNSYEGSVATAQEWTNGLSVTYYIPASLASVTILDETETGGNAFRNCGNLKTVILNEGLRRIRGSTFYNCKSLTEVYIPETVETIIASAFYGCRNLEQIFIPASVVDIGSSAFRDCPALTTVLFEGDAPTVGGSCFYGVNASCVAKVSAKTSGWHADGEGRWNGLILEYVETEQDISDEVSKFADSKLAGYIKDAKSYAAFQSWVGGLDSASAEKVKSSPNAWLSYALDTEALIAAAPKEGDVVIDTFESAATDGAFEFTVKIDGITVGNNALEANIRKVFGVEGAGSLDESEFNEENVDIEFDKPEGGKVKIKAMPKDMAAKQFFMRVKMKQ